MKNIILSIANFALFSVPSVHAGKTWSQTLSEVWHSKELREGLQETFQLLPELLLSSGVPLAMHGNYCGPNHGDPAYKLEVTDALDAACKNHDMCYDPNMGGMAQSCGCDALFVDEIRRNVDSIALLDYKTQAKALAAVALFSRSACQCRLPLRAMIVLKEPKLADKKRCLAY